MPKKKHTETAAEQSARFQAEVKKLIADGALNPTEADAMLDKLTSKTRTAKLSESTDSEENN